MLRPSNRRLLRDFGFVVWLRAEPAELARRLEADLQGRHRATRAHAAPGRLPRSPRSSSARAPLYEEAADVAIETHDRTSPKSSR